MSKGALQELRHALVLGATVIGLVALILLVLAIAPRITAPEQPFARWAAKSGSAQHYAVSSRGDTLLLLAPAVVMADSAAKF